MYVSELLSTVVASVLPDTPWAGLIISNAFLVISALCVLIVLIILSLALFFDFITDVWKIPFAIAADVLKYLGIMVPLWAVISSIVGAIIFILLSDVHIIKWLFAILSMASGIIVYIYGGVPIGVLLGLFPLNTIMMFIATIID